MSAKCHHKLLVIALFSTGLLLAGTAQASDKHESHSWWDPLGLFSHSDLPAPPKPGDLPGIKNLPKPGDLPKPPTPGDLPKPSHSWWDPLGLFGDDNKHEDRGQHRGEDHHGDRGRHRAKGHHKHHDDD